MTEPREIALACSYCGKSQQQVRKLIAGPTVYICDECIKLCNVLLADPTTLSEPTRRQPADRAEKSTLSCSFCGKNQRDVKRMLAGPSATICDECIGLCNDIISEEIEREECADALKARLPGRALASIVRILERGMPAALQIRDVLRDRIIEEATRRRAIGEGPDERLWAPDGLAADWRELQDLLERATLGDGESGRGGRVEDDLPAWVGPIAERLAGTLEVLGALARSLEKPGLEEVRRLHPALVLAREKLREARDMLLVSPPGSSEESS